MSDVRKIAFVGNYLPRKCGIATFTHDLRNAVQGVLPFGQCSVLAVNDGKDHYQYPDEVRFEISEQAPDDYLRAAEYLNLLNVDVVSLQHEFGIYGGPSGSYLLNMLRRLRMPCVSTLHTILRQPSPEQRRVMQELTSLSSRIVVMSDVGRSILNETYSVPERKIDVIPHGIPDMAFADPNFFKDQYSVEGRRVLLTFGLLSPNKGIEKVIEALPQIVAEFPDVVYIVLGATHPNLLREQGELYRESLITLAEHLGVSEHVRFFNQFVELEELKKFLGAADIYVTPYLNEAQITSGTLAYAFGCGKAVVSTPYWHAQELLADDRGVLVPFGDSAAMSREICGLLRDESRRHAMRKRAYLSSREMVWSKTAEHYVATFEAARKCRSERPLKVVPRRDSRELQLPELGFHHLKRMTDSTGMLQHARFTLPNYAEGYCIDDNARALMFTVHLEKRGLGGEELAALSTRYASFVDHAFNREQRKFRNFMGYDRRWLEDVGSEDSQARALWALGTCVGHTQRREIRAWAAELFMQALPGIVESTSPRAWAFALLGIKEYLRRLRGDRGAASIQGVLVSRLVSLYEEAKRPGWSWFEDVVSYDNARLAQALITTAGKDPDPALATAREIGLESLRWLTEVQRAERGHFRPIGSNGFYRAGQPRARFDQQPLEAHATVSACSEAFQVTGDRFWIFEARRAFAWFLGQNDLGATVYNPDSGGCRDGLHVDRVNLNEGAESTLAFLSALVEIQALEARAIGIDEMPESGERNLTTLLNAANQTAT